MLTSSHAYWTWRAGGGPGAVVGAVAPDLPAWGLGAVQRARGVAPAAMLRAVYQTPPWRSVHMAGHTVWGPAAAAALGARGVAAGWAGHLAVDYLSHRDDAWPPLWPLSRRRRPARMSYWQAEHGARRWAAAEVAAMAVAVATDRRGRAARALGVAALVAAAAPLLVRGRGDLWAALGARPDALERAAVLEAPAGEAPVTRPGAPRPRPGG